MGFDRGCRGEEARVVRRDLPRAGHCYATGSLADGTFLWVGRTSRDFRLGAIDLGLLSSVLHLEVVCFKWHKQYELQPDHALLLDTQ